MADYMSGQKILYRYKLNDNFDKGKFGTEYSINNMLITFDWKDFSDRIAAFDKYIKTKINPKGIMDMQMYTPANKKVTYDSAEVFDKDFVIYTIRELGLMEREDIIKICQIYNISVINQSTDHLIKLIIRKQKEMQEMIGE